MLDSKKNIKHISFGMVGFEQEEVEECYGVILGVVSKNGSKRKILEFSRSSDSCQPESSSPSPSSSSSPPPPPRHHPILKKTRVT